MTNNNDNRPAGQPLKGVEREPFEVAIAHYDRSSAQEHLRRVDELRRELLERFPIESWPQMTLERYALGHERSDESFCYWMEFGAREMGSISGGSSRKHILYKHKKKPGWFFPNWFDDVETAWNQTRSDFVQALEFSRNEQWEKIADLRSLTWGPALKQKTLHLYFPDEILPVYSQDHLRHFLRAMGEDAKQYRKLSVVLRNRALLKILADRAEMAGWSTQEMMKFLYWWADPREAKRVYKIAPGRQAMYWQECLSGGYICVGWDEIADLETFESKREFVEEFRQLYTEFYKGNRSAATQKANELWTLRELEPGDLVVANQGTSKVLALGTVTDPGYQYREDRTEYRHTVTVEWDTSFEKAVPRQGRWAMTTVSKVSDQLLEQILTGVPGDPKSPEISVVPTPYRRVASALERKGQLILYGPPGTGKTYTARRFAVWWLLRNSGASQPDGVLSDSKRLHVEEARLSTVHESRRVWWIVANPERWTWDVLFEKGREDYKYGNLKRNYPRVKRGDLVVGYQATPDKCILALASIHREFKSVDGRPPDIEIAPVAKLDEHVSYQEMLEDPILSKSEPMRCRNQGTLFSLTQTEADHLMAIIAERNPAVAQHVVGEVSDGQPEVGPLTRLTFHPSYSYEDFIEGFRPVDAGQNGLTLSLEDGIFKRVCLAAQAHPDKNYLLLIDEINRGNVAKILGELLTLLESDKRGLTVMLPQSKEPFSIPPNVYLVGTMNTADRSIKLLDSALRRRFAFIELMPDVELLRGGMVNDLALDDFLDKLNRRIARSEGREKQIGHSYLLNDGEPVADAEEFASRFREEILPLLQEYCYDEYATLANYIGTALVDPEGQVLNQEILDDPEQLIAALVSEFGSSAGDED